MANRKFSKVCAWCGIAFEASAKHVKCCSLSCAQLNIKGITPDRFWERLAPPDARGCRVWTGSIETGGYGHFHQGRRFIGTHRYAWELTHGPIPIGMSVLHECDNPPCCNPEHLFLGTCKQNADDMVRKGRHHHGSRHANAKLTEDAVRDIRASSDTAKESALKHGVSQDYIYSIRNRNRWKHV